MKTKTWIRIAMLASLTVWGAIGSSAMAPTDDNMTPYRNLAADTLKAFKVHDMPTAKKKAKELEKAWDNDQKDLQKKSPDIWTQIDKAMDDFIKPISDKAPDAAKVETAYETFIGKLQLAVKSAALTPATAVPPKSPVDQRRTVRR